MIKKIEIEAFSQKKNKNKSTVCPSTSERKGGTEIFKNSVYVFMQGPQCFLTYFILCPI